MLRRRIKLCTLFGSVFWVDVFSLPPVVLLYWTFGDVVFPFLTPELPTSAYWWMSAAGTIGFAFSIVVHEAVRLLIARRLNIPIAGTTIFIFGGSAETGSEDTNARSDARMAVVGLSTWLVLGTAFFFLFVHGFDAATPLTIASVPLFLALVNWGLLLVHLMPAYPLDGGHLLRAAIAAWRKDMPWASRIAAAAGSALGIIALAVSVFFIVRGNFIAGIWPVLIGALLYRAANQPRNGP